MNWSAKHREFNVYLKQRIIDKCGCIPHYFPNTSVKALLHLTYVTIHGERWQY